MSSAEGLPPDQVRSVAAMVKIIGFAYSLAIQCTLLKHPEPCSTVNDG